MEHKMYSVHDRKVGAFAPPFYAKTDGEAIRMFMDTCSDVTTLLHRHAHDFHLYRLGTFEDVDGLLKNTDPPEMLISAVNAIGPVGPPVPPNGSSGLTAPEDRLELSGD